MNRTKLWQATIGQSIAATLSRRPQVFETIGKLRFSICTGPLLFPCDRAMDQEDSDWLVRASNIGTACFASLRYLSDIQDRCQSYIRANERTVHSHGDASKLQ
jgi:hypothetical protein